MLPFRKVIWFMTEIMWFVVGSLVWLVSLSLILLAFIAWSAITKDKKAGKGFWESILKIFSRKRIKFPRSD